jgi:hypothetical protein
MRSAASSRPSLDCIGLSEQKANLGSRGLESGIMADLASAVHRRDEVLLGFQIPLRGLTSYSRNVLVLTQALTTVESY